MPVDGQWPPLKWPMATSAISMPCKPFMRRDVHSAFVDGQWPPLLWPMATPVMVNRTGCESK